MKNKKLFMLTIFCYALGLVACRREPFCIDPARVKPNAPCTKELAPVCGCDGKTYGNSCQADNAGVISYKKGKCPKTPCIDSSKINPTICTTQYDPVCGCDGKTYDNSCKAEHAGVISYKQGKCPETSCIDSSKINPNAACTEEYAPVCGCDGKTYDNSCKADHAGVISYKQGKCPGAL